MSGDGGGVMRDCRGHSASTSDSRFGKARPSLHTSAHVETGFPIKMKVIENFLIFFPPQNWKGNVHIWMEFSRSTTQELNDNKFDFREKNYVQDGLKRRR